MNPVLPFVSGVATTWGVILWLKSGRGATWAKIGVALAVVLAAVAVYNLRVRLSH